MVTQNTPQTTASNNAPRRASRSGSRSRSHSRKTTTNNVPGIIENFPYGSNEGDNAALDRLTAAWLRTHPNATLQTTSLFSFMNWSIGRCGTQAIQTAGITTEPARTQAAGGGA